MRIVSSAALALALSLLNAQQQPPAAAPKPTAELLKLVREGEPIGVTSNVTDHVSVQAVLLPPSVCERVFGKEISNKYAAIQLVIGNRNREASLIVHSLYLDYSGWALSGSPRSLQSQADENPRKPWEADTERNQVASVEYRVARGQLLDAQPWTTRNLVRRSIQVAGAVASAFVFNITDQSVVQGITAATGIAGPLFDYFWPDSTIGQMNRISDVGFQVNKVVAKEASEIVVAFFPLDRFLTPDLKKIYLKTPAAFFAPYAMVVDTSVAKLFQPVYKGLLGSDEEARSFTSAAPKAYLYRTEVRRQLDAQMQLTGKQLDAAARSTLESSVAQEYGLSKETLRKYAEVLAFLDRASLNNIRLVVAGVMVIDVDTVPATIETVEFDSGIRSPNTWFEPGEKLGTIRGRFLTGGEVAIANAAALGILELTPVKEGSTDRELRFRFKLKAALKSDAKLDFTVTKKDRAGRSLESKPFSLAVAWEPPVKALMTDAKRTENKLTITGERFYDGPEKLDLKVSLLPSGNPAAAEVAVDRKLITRELTKLDIDLAPLKLPPACWTPKVSVGSDVASSGPDLKPFLEKPTVQLTEAKKSPDSKTVTLTGAGLLDLKSCGAALQIFVRASTTGAKLEPVLSLNLESATKATFAMPQQPANVKFTVVAKSGDVEIAGPEIQ